MPSFFKASADAPPQAKPSAAEAEPPVFGSSGGVGGPADSGCLLKTSEAPWSVVGLATTCSVGLAPAAAPRIIAEALLEAAALAAALVVLLPSGMPIALASLPNPS